MSLKTIDTRGFSCPEPVLMVSQEIKSNPNGEFNILTSTTNAKENISNLLEKSGFKYLVKQIDDYFEISASHE